MLNATISIMCELQHYNDSVFRCRSQIAEAKDSIVSIDSLVKKEKARIVKMKEELLLKRRALKSDEITLSEVCERITQSEKRKMTVTSSKELSSVETELKTANEEKQSIEETTFALMEEMELLQNDLTENESKLSELEKKATEKRQTLTSRIERLSSLLDENLKKYNELLPSLERFRPKFERLAESKDGKAIVAIENGACSGCHFSLSGDIVAKVKSSSEIVNCTNCGRYLFSEQ